MPDVQPLEQGDPERLDAYRIVGRIGEGGQGTVYLGETEPGELVAIKILHERLGRDPAFRDTFPRELEAAKRVARFCTAQVLDSGISGNRPYIVSEYIPGPSLQQVVLLEGPRSGSALERLAIGTATALVALHEAGIIHRDLKPANVLIGPDGPRVIDFGVARPLLGNSTMTSQIVGTPAYMAPEQLAAGEIGRALDVFAWASTMAFAATGRPPFGSDGIPAVINRILNESPDLTGVEPPLRDLLAECLSKDPARRPPARAILDRLVRGHGPSPAGSPGVPVSGWSSITGGVPTTDVSPAHAGPVRVPDDTPTAPGRRAVRLVAVSASVAVTVAGVVALIVAMLPPQEISARRTGQTSPATGPATPSPTETSEHSQAVSSPAASPRPSGRRQTRPATTEPTAAPTSSRKPSDAPEQTPLPSATPKVTPSEVGPTDSEPSKRPSPAPTPVELGAGRFTGYCQELGWEWVEYRETPKPGAYCIKRKNDQTMPLTSSMLDAGCRWRYDNERAFHRFKGKSNYCYANR
jgi:serine/threonine protein kinase